MNPSSPSPSQPKGPTGGKTGKPTSASSGEKSVKPPRRKRRWLRWLGALFFLLVLLIVFLPNILALPMFRQQIFDRFFNRYNAKLTVGNLSLSWFAPVRAGNVELKVEESAQAALVINRLEGDVSLLNLLFGRDLGTFRLTNPVLNVEFNKDGTNLTRLIRAMSGASIIKRPAKLVLIDAGMQLRGQDSAEAWKFGEMNFDVALIPAADSPAGVLTLQGENAKLISQMELTPEMCNDILKYVAPQLYHPTHTAGRVSLELDRFNWPLGKTDLTDLKGRLTLHSVEVGSDTLESLWRSFGLQRLPATMQIAKDDIVEFNLRDGRVNHQNLVINLAVLQAASHGSVGLDESLDFNVDLQFQSLEGSDASESSWLKTFQQLRPTVHVTGTLNDRQEKIEGVSSPLLRPLADFLNRLLQRREPQPRPGAAPAAGNKPVDSKPVPGAGAAKR